MEELTPEQQQMVAEKAAAAAMKRQVIASDCVLKDFNWVMSMPLD